LNNLIALSKAKETVRQCENALLIFVCPVFLLSRRLCIHCSHTRQEYLLTHGPGLNVPAPKKHDAGVKGFAEYVGDTAQSPLLSPGTTPEKKMIRLWEDRIRPVDRTDGFYAFRPSDVSDDEDSD